MLGELKGQCQNLAAMHENDDMRCQQLEKKLEEATRELWTMHDLKNQLEESLKGQELLEKEHVEFKEEMSALASSLKNEETFRREAEDKLTSLLVSEKQASKLKNKIQKMDEAFEAERVLMNKEIAGLRGELSASIEGTKSKEENLFQIKEKLAQAEARNAGCKIKLSSQSELIQGLEEMIRAAETSASESMEQIRRELSDRLEAEGALKGELNEMEALNQKLQNVMVAERESSIQVLEQQLEVQLKEANQKHLELLKKNAEREAQLLSKIEELEKIVRECQSELNERHDELRNAKNDSLDLNEKIDFVRLESEKLLSENTTLEEELSGCVSIQESIKAKAECLESELKAAKLKFENLGIEHDSFKKSSADQIEGLEDGMRVLKSVLNEANGKVSALTEECETYWTRLCAFEAGVAIAQDASLMLVESVAEELATRTEAVETEALVVEAAHIDAMMKLHLKEVSDELEAKSH